ncbi:phage tail spike protein [Streptococcus parasanguinis]|uniref:phage tail spike protein n=1 Tax=Streptococcus parasanguinis TaxID=1318 RepID=UPI00068EE731|nr:phage tail spike protein [Streptococcus parasanguinis]
MIYLQEGNFPLNEAFSSEIVQEANSTYQLTFKFPTSDPKWALLTPETELVADDLHGEQYFSIFEVEKQHGYVTVYANQVATLLNGYSINKINVDRVNGATVMNALVAGFKRETPFTFFSDVMSKHTLNLKDISAMEALAKDKHSIVGQWGGDLVRDKYSVRLLENGGIENESLFAYKKNMKSFQESKSTKELRTRIHFKKVIEAHEEGKKDQILTVTIDSPLINKYKHIYEADMEVQDQDVVDQKTLEEYGKRYFRETLCDMIEESLEIDVVGQADQPVHMFDIVSIFHEGYDVDLRKKITKYKFNPMSIKLVSIGFGEVARTLADSISGMVNDSVEKKMKSYDAEYEAKVQKLVDNANAEYDKQAKELEHKITDGIEQAKAQAEVVKQEISAQVTEKIKATNQANKNEITEEFKAQYNGIEVKMQGLKATTDQLKTSDVDIKKLVNDFKAQTQSQFSGIQGAQSRFEQSTEKVISDLTNVTSGKADRSYVEQTVAGVKEEFTNLKVGSRNYAEDYDFTRGLWFFAHGDSSDSTGTADNGIYTITGNTNTWKQAQLFSSTAPSWATSKTTALDYLEKGEPYTISFYAKRNSGSGKMWALLRENRKSGGNRERITAQFQLTDDWQLYKVSVPALEKSDEFDFWRIIIGYSEAGSISFKKVELTQSTTRTDAGPAPEDQNYLVEKVQATFERTVHGLTTQLTRLETKTGPNGEIEQRMLTYSEKAAVDVVKATRQILEQGYVSKSQYTEDVAGINRKFESISTSTDSKISSKLAEFKQGIDGQFSTFSTEFGMKLSSQSSVLNDKLDDFKDSINGRFANYQQTVNGQISTIISQFDGVLKKTDINITDGQISFGTGKSINGRTISSLLVQEPEAIALIAQLIKVKGDMVVDGSILGRHIASESVETGHMKAGSVTTPILASNSVTADKMLVDSAMINKLVSNQAFIRELTSQKAFSTQLASIDFSAERIKGGRLESNTGALVFDLDSSAMNMLTDTAVIRRVFNNFPTQFIRYGTHIENGNRFSKTIIGSNRDGTENSGNRTFSGIEIYNSTNEDVEDYTKFYADKLYLQHSEYKQGWIIQNAGKPRIAPLNGTTYSEIIASDFRMIYTADGNHRSVGTYLWDLLTCFGILQKYGWDLKNSAAQRHIGSVLSKYNYR